MLEAIWLYDFASHMSNQIGMDFESAWSCGEEWILDDGWRHEDPCNCADNEISLMLD